MTQLSKRIGVLESANGGNELSLELRAWLGHQLTEEERAELAQIPPKPYTPPTEAEVADWSPEFRQWLTRTDPQSVED